MYERTKSKQRQNQVTSYSNWAHILLFDLAHKQWNGIIKGSLRAISVNRKISCQYYGSVCSSLMSGYGVNPIFFNKKNEDWTSRTFATPTQLCPITSHFSLTTAALPSPPTHTHIPPFPSKWASYAYHPLPGLREAYVGPSQKSKINS